MNANKMLLAVATTLLTACSGLTRPVSIDFAGCQPNSVPPTKTCQPVPGGRVNVNLDKYKVAPPNVCANPGDSLTLEIHSRSSGFNSVVVLPKDGDSYVDWLIRFNDGKKDEIIIKIPNDPALSGRNFNYRVANLWDGHCVDPMIHIN